jgi:GntR family transcriptional regulator, rspAB operon transcriptional repressor
VKLQVDRFRRLTLPQEGRMARVHRDHAAIVAALEARDGDAAAAAMAAHLATLQHSIADIRKAYPGYFAEEAGKAAR